MTARYSDNLINIDTVDDFPPSYIGDFVDCIEAFVDEVQSDPETGAIIVIGALLVPEYVLAGLVVGCTIYAIERNS